MICKLCKEKNVIKVGFFQGRQRYKCKNCAVHFFKYSKRLSKNDRLRAVRFCSYGVSMNTVAKMFFVTATTVARWIKWYKNYPNEKKPPYHEYDRGFAKLLTCSSNKASKRCRILNFQITQLIKNIQNYKNVKPEKII